MSDSKTPDKNYDDLKAKLGIRKREAVAAPSASSPTAEPGASPGQPAPDRTPPGGFDLGLEGRSRAPIADVDLGDVSIKSSPGTRWTLVLVALALLAAAAFLGYSFRGTTYDRQIATQQQEDAADLLKRIQALKVGPKGEAIEDVVKEFAAIVGEVHKKVDGAAKADSLTDALLKSLEKDLDRLRNAAIAYVEKGPRLGDIFSKQMFNGEAVRAVLNYNQVLERLYTSALLMANEKGVLVELQTEFEPATLQIPARQRFFRVASIAPEGSYRKGFLVPVTVLTAANGDVLTQVKPVDPPPPGVLPDPNVQPTTQLKVKYDNPKQVGREEDWVDSDSVATYELSGDISEEVKRLVLQQQDRYNALLLKRLFERVADLKRDSDPLDGARKKMIEALTKLGGG